MFKTNPLSNWPVVLVHYMYSYRTRTRTRVEALDVGQYVVEVQQRVRARLQVGERAHVQAQVHVRRVQAEARHRGAHHVQPVAREDGLAAAASRQWQINIHNKTKIT